MNKTLKTALSGLGLAVALAVCSTPVFAGVLKKPYLIYEGQNTTMTVLWQDNASESTNVLSWGTDTTYSLGSVTVPEYLNRDDRPDLGTSNQHKYKITGLTPSTKYYYKVESAPTATVYGTGSFVTAPDDNATSVKFLGFGDTRSGPLAMDGVMQEMRKAYTADPGYQTFNLQAGDWVSSDAESSWTAQWFNANPNTVALLAEQPVNGVKGNHENSSGYSKFFPKYYPFPYTQLVTKSTDSLAYNSFFWSFDYGPVHFTIVDQYTTYLPGTPQYNWVVNDLSTTTKPWKVLVYHEPAWNAGTHGNNITTQQQLDPLVRQYGVDFVYAGHSHNYCRCQANNSCEANGDTIVPRVPYITNGNGGAGLYAVDTTNTGPYRHVIKALMEYGYMTFDVNDKDFTLKSFAVTKPDGTRLSSSVYNPDTISTPIETVKIHHFKDISGQVSVATGNFVYNRATKLYTGNLTVTNNGADIADAINVALNNLTCGVTLVNAGSSAYHNAPKPYVVATTGGLAAGASVTVPVQFTNPANAKINFTPATFQE